MDNKHLHKSDRSAAWSLLLRGGGKAFGVRTVWAVTSYLSTLLLARWLGKEAFGVYSFIDRWLLIAVAIAGVGGQGLMLRYVAQYRVQNKPEAGTGLFRFGLRRSLCGGLIVYAASIGLALAGASTGRITDATPFLIGLAAIPCVVLLDFLGATLRSHSYVVLALAPRDILWRLTIILAGYYAAMTLAEQDRLLVVVTAMAAAALVLAILQYLLVSQTTRRAYGQVEPETHGEEWTRVSRPLWAMTVTTALFRSADVLILGLYLKPEFVGVYSAATRVAELSRFFLTSLNVIFGPMIAARYHAGNMESLKVLCARAAHLAFWPSAMVALVMMVYPAEILGLLGDNFREGVPILIILSLARMVDAAAGDVAVVVNVTGHQREAANAQIAVGVLTVVALFIVIPIWGVMGATVTAALSIVARNVWLYILNIRLVGIDPSIIGALRYHLGRVKA